VFRLLPYLFKLWRTAGKADLFHIMANSGWAWHLFAAPAVWVARSRGVPVVVNYRGGEAAEFLDKSASLVRFTVRQTRALVVPSGFLQGVFASFGMPASIVPNIIDLSRFHARDPVRTGAPHLVVARNLEPLYDNLTAIRAFQIVQAKFSQARLTIAGSGPEAQRLRQSVQDMGLTHAVQFAGRLERDAMAALYRSADIMLNPSLADNMPNSVLEAWASGVPVVSTNVGGIPHLAQHGVTAALVPPADPAAMAQACVALLSEDSLWQQRAQAGLLEAQRYTWQRVQPVLGGVYQHAIAQPQR
jgi:glycosyltransferase involved in cell wall biosynthesis